MKNLKFAKIYTLVPKNGRCNYVVFETYTDEDKFNQSGVFNAIKFVEAEITQCIPTHGDPQKCLLAFGMKVDKLIKSDQRTVFIISHHGDVQSSGATNQDMLNLRQAVTDYTKAYVSAYQNGYEYGYDELYEFELVSHNIFTNKELTQFNSQFAQLGYNTGKRIGVDQGRQQFEYDWGF